MPAFLIQCFKNQNNRVFIQLTTPWLSSLQNLSALLWLIDWKLNFLPGCKASWRTSLGVYHQLILCSTFKKGKGMWFRFKTAVIWARVEAWCRPQSQLQRRLPPPFYLLSYKMASLQSREQLLELKRQKKRGNNTIIEGYFCQKCDPISIQTKEWFNENLIL